MKKAILFGVLLLTLNISSAPTSKSSESSSSEEDGKITVDEEFFPDVFVIYSGEHDIFNLVVPGDDLNFNDENPNDEDSGNHVAIFFTLADVKDGKKDYKGIYMIRDGKTSEILANGRATAVSSAGDKYIYFAADDGIYALSTKTNVTSKYGNVNDKLIDIAKENGTDVIYILNEKEEVFKVTDNGNTKTKIDEITNAKQIILDLENNLFYYNDNLKLYVYNGKEVKEIKGLPENVSYVDILKPPFVFDDGVPLILDDKSYIIYANGTSKLSDFEFKVRPTSVAMEMTLIQYAAYNKKIYEYNVLAMVLTGSLDALKDFLKEKENEIQSVASRSLRFHEKNTV